MRSMDLNDISHGELVAIGRRVKGDPVEKKSILQDVSCIAVVNSVEADSLRSRFENVFAVGPNVIS